MTRTSGRQRMVVVMSIGGRRDGTRCRRAIRHGHGRTPIASLDLLQHVYAVPLNYEHPPFAYQGDI